MVKKLFIYIFIYTLLVGCNTQNPLNSECETDCYLNIEASELQLDDNGYYHIEWLDGYSQTFSTLNAITGLEQAIVKVYWNSDSGIEHGGYWVSSVNHASYTNGGVAHTVLSAWEEQIGDTITVYAWYQDECNIEYIDSIKVIVEDEI